MALGYFDLSNLLRTVVIDQNWGFFRTTVMNPWNHPDNLHWEKKNLLCKRNLISAPCPVKTPSCVFV